MVAEERDGGARRAPASEPGAEIAACAPLLAAYAWPGNVRELRNLMERLALFLAAEPLQALTPNLIARIAPEILRDDGSTTLASVVSAPLAGQAGSEETLQDVLTRFDGNRAAAASYLGISRTTLWRRLGEKS
jgi:propionate catabolism operon transcriptional regulator